MKLAITLTTMAIILSLVIPIAIYYKGKNKMRSAKCALGINIGMFFATLFVVGISLASGSVSAAPAAEAAVNSSAGWGYIAAALATGLGSIGAGIAVASGASAALGAISENDKIFGKALIFVALAEGVALYGLLVAFMIISNL